MKNLRLLVALLISLLAGCTQQSGKESEGGIAAVVNGSEITNRQIDYIYDLSAVPGMSVEESANLKRRILADLVRIELLSAKAKEMKLDQSPDYSIAVYSAQKNVLASFAEKQIADVKSAVSPEAAESVVQNNPQFFAARKLFVYDEVLFPGVDMPLLNTLDKMAVNGASLSQLLDTIKAKQIPFRKTLKALTTEKIPPTALALLNRLTPNTPQVIYDGNKLAVILLLHDALPAPLEGDQARKSAVAMIATNHQRESLSKAMNQLLENAKITYYGDYSKPLTPNSKLTPLPAPDTAKAERQFRHKLYLAGILSISIVLAIMALTSFMRTLYSRSWLPRMRPAEPPSELEPDFRYIRQTTLLSRRLYLYAMGLLIVAAVGYDLLLLWHKLPVLVILASVAGGLVIGYFASRLFNIGLLMECSRNVYAVIVGVLALPIFAGIVLIVRLTAS